MIILSTADVDVHGQDTIAGWAVQAYLENGTVKYRPITGEFRVLDK